MMSVCLFSLQSWNFFSQQNFEIWFVFVCLPPSLREQIQFSFVLRKLTWRNNHYCFLWVKFPCRFKTNMRKRQESSMIHSASPQSRSAVIVGWFWSFGTDGRTLSVKIVITTGRDCGRPSRSIEDNAIKSYSIFSGLKNFLKYRANVSSILYQLYFLKKVKFPIHIVPIPIYILYVDSSSCFFLMFYYYKSNLEQCFLYSRFPFETCILAEGLMLIREP